LIRAEKIKKENLEKLIQKLKFTHTQAAKVELKAVEEEASKLVHKRYGGESQPGVTFTTFLTYSKMFNGRMEQVKTNIIRAFGIDLDDPQAMLYQEQFIRLKCFMEYYTMPKEQIIDIWVKILDPQSLRRIDRSDMYNFLELLARGNTNQE
jgi:hypothetical protein